jgi:hydrogenase maturation protease
VSSASGTLILGWGNPGRLDDGLGPALVAAVGEAAPPGVTVESDYQLQVECAADVAQHERVVFVDADRSGAEPFWMRRLTPENGRLTFSTHSISPETVLGLARDLFAVEPEAWLLGIRGYDFDGFGEGLSERAGTNLAAAVRFVRTACERERFRAIDPNDKFGTDTHDREGDSCKTAST